MEKKKSLQKVTDLENINSKKQLREFIKENPKNKIEVFDSIIERLNNSYAEKLGEEDKLMNLLDEFFF